MKTTRFAYVNLLQTSGVIIVPSSEQASMPRAALLRPGSSDRWRSKTGWTIVTGDNDRIDFNRAGVKNATIAAGNYATAALLAVAIVAALNAADAGQGWACTYSGVTFKFTISATPTFTLLFLTGANFVASVHLDLGYTSTDKAAATSQVAENVSYQSRHSIDVDLITAQALTLGIARGHNVSSAGTIVLRVFSSSMIAGGFGQTAYDLNQTLAGTDPRVAFFGSLTKRYLRLLITDVQNSAGYNEIGVWFPGPHVQPTILESISFVERYEPLSEVLYADGGAHHQVRRARRLVYRLLWEEIEQANIDIFRALNLAMPMGACFFLILDAVDNPTTSTVYGYMRTGLEITMVAATYSNVGPWEFAEALG